MMMDLTNRYSVQVYSDPASDGFLAVCPEFPHLSAFGETRAEALDEMQEALELAVETYRDEGWPLPDAKQPPSASLPSGEFRVRVPRTIHMQLAAQAEADGVSQNTLVVAYIAHGLGREESSLMLRDEIRQGLAALHGHIEALVQVGASASGTTFDLPAASGRMRPPMIFEPSQTLNASVGWSEPGLRRVG